MEEEDLEGHGEAGEEERGACATCEVAEEDRVQSGEQAGAGSEEAAVEFGEGSASAEGDGMVVACDVVVAVERSAD